MDKSDCMLHISLQSTQQDRDRCDIEFKNSDTLPPSNVAILNDTVLPRISEEFPTRTVDERPLGATTLALSGRDFSFELA
jgi:hypothetical protein